MSGPQTCFHPLKHPSANAFTITYMNFPYADTVILHDNNPPVCHLIISTTFV